MVDKIIIERNNNLIETFRKQFATNREPIEVKFRDIVPELKNIDRYTHLIHTYPAKLLVHIPYFFLNNTILSKEGDNVLDPFNGTGTVYLESLISGRNAYGADSNPLARLIANVKSKIYNTENLKKILNNLINSAIKSNESYIPDVVNREKWFSPKITEDLSKILFQINQIENKDIKNFMLVSFSNCVKKVSYADPRVSVPVRLNALKYEVGSDLKLKTQKKIEDIENINVLEKFKTITLDNIKRFKKLEETNISLSAANHISSDARALYDCSKEINALADNSIQLIITSPPYAGAQKYIRSSSLHLGWTGLAQASELKMYDKKNIGRENYTKSEINIDETGIIEADKLIGTIKNINISRANIACQYLQEMKNAINEMVRVLNKGGYLVMVIGNNKVCNLEFNTQEYLTSYIEAKGLNLEFKLIDDITSYGLMTKRNKTADIISREYILVFKK